MIRALWPALLAGAVAAAASLHWPWVAGIIGAGALGGVLARLGGRGPTPAPVPPLPAPVPQNETTASDLAHELATLRAVVDGMVEGVWITRDDGTILQHNDALKAMLFTTSGIVGKKPAELLDEHELAVAVTKACRENLPSRLELTVEGLRPRVVSIHVSPLGKELGGSSAVFFDVTELRHLEKVRKDFVANVSHELRTPITAIRGYAETLKGGALADAANAPRMVDIIHRQSERLSDLVEDLLELSRLESRELKLAERPVNVARTAARAADAVRPKAQARSVTLELDVADSLFVLADERGCEQVLLNLLDNGVKYTHPGGSVRLTARALPQGPVELEVKDTGIGMEVRHLPRVFERFYRVDKGRSREMGGTGLGLSIVKHLVTAMHGDVRVESAPGKGSIFTVQLRAPTGESTEEPAVPEPVASPPTA